MLGFIYEMLCLEFGICFVNKKECRYVFELWGFIIKVVFFRRLNW